MALIVGVLIVGVVMIALGELFEGNPGGCIVVIVFALIVLGLAALG